MSITSSPTWQQLEARWDNGFETLLAQEQEAIALWWLEAETMNGRLDQYFWNSAGDQALIARRGLHSLRMPVTLQAFNAALALFGSAAMAQTAQTAQTRQVVSPPQAQAWIDLARRLGTERPELRDPANVKQIVLHTSHHTHYVIGSGARIAMSSSSPSRRVRSPRRASRGSTRLGVAAM